MEQVTAEEVVNDPTAILIKSSYLSDGTCRNIYMRVAPRIDHLGITHRDTKREYAEERYMWTPRHDAPRTYRLVEG
jgi:hypothetical protein